MPYKGTAPVINDLLGGHVPVAFGVLPPVSSLSPAQAMYHFISGYTAKVAGTEIGVKEPSATFSPCFGGPFLVWHPSKYAELLAAKMKQHNARVWLVNTGWSGGAHGVGKRIKLAHTRAIVDAIHNGSLAGGRTRRDPVFGFEVVTACPVRFLRRKGMLPLPEPVRGGDLSELRQLVNITTSGSWALFLTWLAA